ASVLKRHATSSLLKLSLLICSSGEYLVLARSPPHVRHSRVGAPACPDSRPFVAANKTRRIARDEPSSGIRRGVIKPRSHALVRGWIGENAGHDAPGSRTGQVPRPRKHRRRALFNDLDRLEYHRSCVAVVEAREVDIGERQRLDAAGHGHEIGALSRAEVHAREFLNVLIPAAVDATDDEGFGALRVPGEAALIRRRG